MFTSYKSGDQLSPRSILIWRLVQSAVWLVGAVIFLCLLMFPELGLLLFWNILIPVAPALIVVAVGVWRNVCPLATTTLFPRHMGWSRRRKMTHAEIGVLGFIAVIALYIIVPLRHAVFNLNGPATAMLLLSTALVGTTMGFFYEWKSAWCSSLCPIHPVEKLYGSKVLFTMPNAHCSQCMKCVVPCPDSTANYSPSLSSETAWHRASNFLVIGGLPGFIWGWFHTPDAGDHYTVGGLLDIYRYPLSGMVVTLVVYALLKKFTSRSYQTTIGAVFAAAAVSCYYWYRIPSLTGFGPYGDDGLLVNLQGIIPQWSVLAAASAATAFFFWWIVLRKPNGRSWVLRPAYARASRKTE